MKWNVEPCKSLGTLVWISSPTPWAITILLFLWSLILIFSKDLFHWYSNENKKKNFPVLECEFGFWEIRLGIVGALSSWLPFITFTKLVELRFAKFVLLHSLFDIKFFVLNAEKKPYDSIWNIYNIKF